LKVQKGVSLFNTPDTQDLFLSVLFWFGFGISSNVQGLCGGEPRVKIGAIREGPSLCQPKHRPYKIGRNIFDFKERSGKFEKHLHSTLVQRLVLS
jgi:hypothetical protein